MKETLPFELTPENDIFNLTEKIHENTVKKRGMTLDELFNSCEDLFSKSHEITKHKPDTLVTLKELLLKHFDETNAKNGVMLCNYNMKIAKQGDWWSGHISPLGRFPITNSLLKSPTQTIKKQITYLRGHP